MWQVHASLIDKKEKLRRSIEIARKQVDDGAQVIDVNMDDGLPDGVQEMTNFQPVGIRPGGCPCSNYD